MRQKSDKSPCCQSFREEFKTQKFTLNHEQPADFCCSQWQHGQRSIIWLIYRWLLAAFFGGGVIGSLCQTFNGGLWFIYLTDWGFTLCFYACSYGAVIATIFYFKPSYFAPGSWSLRAYWASHFITCTLAILITFVFWTALYPTMPEMGAELYNLWAHAFNSICMIFDCFMVAFPTRLLHFVYPMIVGLTYGIFSLIYYFSGGVDFGGNRYIYYILDWSQPGLAIGTVIGCLLLAFIFCIIVFYIHRLRVRLYERYGRKPNATTASTETIQTV